MFDETRLPRKRIAIIGGGISGLSAAYELAATHDVTLFEAAPRLGGHARTVMAGVNGDQPVDTGFIVFNYVTYPHLTRLFRDLDVPVAKSEMSFGASIDGGRIEYGFKSLGALTAQRRNLARPRFLGMIRDILRFGAKAEATARDGMSIDDLVAKLQLGRWFRDYYLMPMCGAIWSTPTEEIGCFPALPLVSFFRNHALLAGATQHQWWTVEGGSREYVRRLEAALIARGCRISTSTRAAHVSRDEFGIELFLDNEPSQRFDEVVFACHSDQALGILGPAATTAERQALGSIRYQPNVAVLHRDPSQMPRRRACWSSWSYRSQEGAIGVTYWMNRLQNIPEIDPLFVTLNPSRPIDERLVYDQTTFAHPVFDAAALSAQERLRGMQGDNNTWFAGAYHRNGFHEDGIASAMRVVRGIRTKTIMGDTDAAYRRPPAEIGIPADL
ncbi:NAD(P)/FAD-dependent oxidoreductase [Pseudoruegeria sp. HB172150]|uniref:NAD(P)/FAD-dependent oxidoreductase n=1 Tax=Pseudoruegeria sp. HB172150 TaxID=2721164 RepID=UPI001553622A|nr:FAD-dependent oxidoreductase [Pseudoruegeria sp. HB172150]